jgi:hypothetical protein
MILGRLMAMTVMGEQNTQLGAKNCENIVHTEFAEERIRSWHSLRVRSAERVLDNVRR